MMIFIGNGDLFHCIYGIFLLLIKLFGVKPFCLSHAFDKFFPLRECGINFGYKQRFSDALFGRENRVADD